MQNHSILDPNSRGMNKQTMLDWLRINHPHTPVKSGISKTEVARIVREMQPEYFPDPDNETPIISSTASTHTPNTSSSSTRPDRSLLSPTQGKPVVPLLASIVPPPYLDPKIDPSQKKRAASDTLNCDQNSKRVEIGPTTICPDPSQPLKKEKSRSKSAKPHRIQPVGTSSIRSIAAKSMSKSISVTVTPQVSKNPGENIPPLIDFSETDWMSSPNPAIGQDIPPIEISPESTTEKKSNKKSGIEVFKEERQRAQQLQDLAESVDHLTSRLEMNEKSDLSALAEELRREEEIRLVNARVADLEKKVEQISLLQTTVTNLEAEVKRLCGQLATAVEDIRAQEEVITKLMSLEEMDDNGSANSSTISSDLSLEEDS